MKKIIATILLLTPFTTFGLTTKETVDNYDFFFVDGDLARVYNKTEGISITNEAGVFLDDFYNEKKGTTVITKVIKEVTNELPENNKNIVKDFGLDGYTFNFTTPLNHYYEVFNGNEYYYTNYSGKTVADEYIIDIVDKIILMEKLDVGFSGIQAILDIRKYLAYTTDINKASGTSEYFDYPLESLVIGATDCDSSAILIGTMLELYSKRGGYYNVDVIFVEFKDHIALALNSTNYFMYGTHYVFNNKKYYILETTTASYGIGDWYDNTRNEATLKDLEIKYNY